jgi:rhodanese-related sulfurtransferase
MVTGVGERKASLEIKRLSREILFIIGLSVVLGVAVNFSLLRRFLAGEFRQSFIDEKEYAGVRFITLAEAEDLFVRKTQTEAKIAFLDSRSREDFAAGHVPGARSVPVAELKGKDDRTSGGELDEALAFLEDHILVVYCEGGDCQTSVTLAQLLHEQGFADIRILSGGWEEWTAAGLPVEGSP